MSDVLQRNQPEEEVKTEPPQINVEELNDIALGEFRIESMKMKDAERGVVLWERNDWDLNSNEE